jgi:hypothetical protein
MTRDRSRSQPDGCRGHVIPLNNDTAPKLEIRRQEICPWCRDLGDNCEPTQLTRLPDYLSNLRARAYILPEALIGVPPGELYPGLAEPVGASFFAQVPAGPRCDAGICANRLIPSGPETTFSARP